MKIVVSGRPDMDMFGNVASWERTVGPNCEYCKFRLKLFFRWSK